MGEWDMVFLPPNCINGHGLTIDDMTVADLASATNQSIAVGDYNFAATLKTYLAENQIGFEGRGRQLSELGYYVGRNK